MTRPTLASTLGRASASAVAVLALASLAACGGDDGGDDDPASSESSTSSDASDEPDASEATDEAGDSDAAAGEEMDPAEFVDIYAESLEGATTASISMTFGGAAAGEASGVADFTSDPPSMQLNLKDPSTGQDMGMVLVDGIMYIEIQPDQYLEYDLSDPSSPLGDIDGQLDPRAMIDTFEKGVTGATYVGEEEKDGEQMEHYTVTIDPAAMIAGSDLPSDAPTPDLPAETTFDLWFDADGNFRRMQGDLGPAGGEINTAYDNWGDPVEITAPPKSQVQKLPKTG